MPYFRGWFSDQYLDTWFDGDSAPPPDGGSGSGGVSKKLPINALAPRPFLPPWRQIAGPEGQFLTHLRNAINETLSRDHLWGNHVDVEFTGAGVALKVPTGLGGAVKGYQVVRSNADVRVWDATPPEPSEERGVHWLQASGAARLTIYFY